MLNLPGLIKIMTLLYMAAHHAPDENLLSFQLTGCDGSPVPNTTIVIRSCQKEKEIFKITDEAGIATFRIAKKDICNMQFKFDRGGERSDNSGAVSSNTRSLLKTCTKKENKWTCPIQLDCD
ncbi:MAG: hypothetical protein WBA74_05580 [Cyclobacteriaceae bacterium]